MPIATDMPDGLWKRMLAASDLRRSLLREISVPRWSPAAAKSFNVRSVRVRGGLGVGITLLMPYRTWSLSWSIRELESSVRTEVNGVGSGSEVGYTERAYTSSLCGV